MISKSGNIYLINTNHTISKIAVKNYNPNKDNMRININPLHVLLNISNDKYQSTYIYDKDYFLKIRAMDPVKMSDLDVASRFIYLNRTCFNGMYRVNSKGQFNVPFGRYKNPVICDEDNLRAVSRALQDVEILNEDYKVAVSKAKAGDFVYFDPPYYPISSTSSFTSYTKDGFAEKEQVELRDTFAELSSKGCYVMLSNSDSAFIRDTYGRLKNVTITTVSAGRAINSKATGRGKITELVITNYPVGGNNGGEI